MSQSGKPSNKKEAIIKELENGIALIAYLDLANMFHWQSRLKRKFQIEEIISELQNISSIKEIKIYFGIDTRKKKASKTIQERVEDKGAVFITKPVKYIKRIVNRSFFFKKSTFTLLDTKTTTRVNQLIKEAKEINLVIEEPKCNFDVEITMDIINDMKKIKGILLFSGDSDFRAPLELLKRKGKKVYIVGARGQVAKELFETGHRFINFGIFLKPK